MKKQHAFYAVFIAAAIAAIQTAAAETPELSTPPASDADKEAAYATAIENRTTDILKLLAVAEAAKSNNVHDAILAQYRARFDTPQQTFKSGYVHCHLQTIANGLSHQRMIGNLTLADDVFRAGNLIGKHGGNEIFRRHTLQLRWHFFTAAIT